MVWTNFITVEPTMFLQQVGDTLTYVIFQNLFIDKICQNQLRYDKADCDLYAAISDELEPSQQYLIPMMNKIQESSSSFLLYNSLVENSFPVILVLFLGVWSDAHRRRKPPLLLSLFGKLLRSFGLLLNAYFMSWSPITLLFTVALPHSLGGASSVFNMAAFSYLSDTSVPRNRTWRLGIAEFCWHLGSPVGLYLGAYLFKVGGYICVFAASATFHLVALLYTVFVLPEVPQPKPSLCSVGKYGFNYGTCAEVQVKRVRCFSENETTNRDVENNNEKDALAAEGDSSEEEDNGKTSVKEIVVGSIKAIMRKRPNHTRKCLLSLGAIMLLYGIAFHGEANMKYLFTRNKFQFREQQFSAWTIFDALMLVVGLTVVMPITSKLLRLSDTLAGGVASMGRAASRACIALAPSSNYLYIASIIDVTGVIGPLSARSLASKCVLRDERGKVFAFLGCIEAIVPLIAVPLYSLIYSHTLEFAPSSIYFVSTGIYFVTFLIFGILFIASKMNIVQFTGTDTTALTTPIDKNLLIVPGLGVPYMYRRGSLS